MAVLLVSSKIIGPPPGEQNAPYVGEYQVAYSVEVTTDSTDGAFAGPATVLRAGQSAVLPNHRVPSRWDIYDYRLFLGDTFEVDASSFCKHHIVIPTNERRTHWTVIAGFTRLFEGEMPELDVNGVEIANPINRYPRYYIRKFTKGEDLEGGWKRDAIQEDGIAGGASNAKIFGPFSRSGVVPDPDPHPDDGVPGRLFNGINVDPKLPQPITTSNLMDVDRLPRIDREHVLLIVRMNWPSIQAFLNADEAQQDTVWNGGDDWEGNTASPDLTIAQDPTGRKFFGARFGQARYLGGSIVGFPQHESGVGYYVGEFRYELLTGSVPNGYEREFVVRVRNSSLYDKDGNQILLGGDTPAVIPQWLKLDGTAAGVGPDIEDQNWIRFYYSKGYDYSKVTNGGLTAAPTSGTIPIKVGMFRQGNHWTLPGDWPYPSPNAVPYEPP